MESIDIEVGAADLIANAFQRILEKKKQNLNLEDEVGPSIYRVPSMFRDLSPRCFDPRLVSIGPIHRNHPRLQGFDGQKETYIYHLLDRVGSPRDQTLNTCLQKLSGSVGRIKRCYADTDPYNDVQLAKMMVIDGCFILGFILELSIVDGPVWKNMLITQAIIYDLLLIENQIPFFVLKTIFDCTILRYEPTATLIKPMMLLLNIYNIFDAKLVITNVSEDNTIDHILGLLHKSFEPEARLQSRFKSNPKAHSAVDLNRAGVNFRPYEGNNWVMAMKLVLPKFSCFPWFCCKPTLMMPVLCINDFTDLVLRNLIIYEQCNAVQNYVASYASAMNMLIDTPEDVATLASSQVLFNDLGSNQNAADMINNICLELPVVEFIYHEQFQQLDTYYNSYWPNIAAGLKRKYFSSPWNIIALFAGIVLFALTVVQTIYGIKAA